MDTIEREIVIAAPPERVYEIVTQPEHMGVWFGDAGAERDGDTIKMRWAEHGEAELRVVEEQPPTKFAYRWDANDAGIGDTLVEFTLTPEGDGTRVKVVESGWTKLHDHARAPERAARGQHRRLEARARRPGALRADRHRVTEDVFTALADPTRREILDLLATHGHGTATTLAAALPVSRPAVIKHLAVLDRAGLVAAQRHGREVRYVVVPRPLAETAAWMARLAADWDARLDAVKRLAES